ncbi:MAG: hypothetical protein K9N23_15890 [Akkermansiaceae bacterium]|nr:hypothetical protein [Akkermansiaceae bacterium]MCF7733172.1 hypothetical protein [Akkermansiaceae bacterium]
MKTINLRIWRILQSVLLLVLAVGCKRQEPPAPQGADNPQDASLDPLVLCLTQDHENLRRFFHADATDTAIETLFGELRADLESGIDADSKPGMWLSGTKINQQGAGMLSIFGELDEPASVLIVRHHRDKPEVTISKPVKWDWIMLDGKEYARKCERKLFVFGTSEGVSSIEISFEISASPAADVGEPRKFSGSFEYLLVGHYMFEPDCKGMCAGWTQLFHYDPGKQGAAKYGKAITRLGSTLLSRTVFRQGDFELTEVSKRHLLTIMDMVTVYGINQPENAVYKDLLKREPLELAKPRRRDL